jgi:hypothetical protein
MRRIEMNIASEAIIARIVSEFSYTEKEAKVVVPDLETSDPIVQEAFEKWWSGGGLDEELVVQGYTLQKLIDKHGFNPINAFLTMNWLIREPEKALRGLSKRRDYFLLSPEAEARYEKRKADFKKQKEQENQ